MFTIVDKKIYILGFTMGIQSLLELIDCKFVAPQSHFQHHNIPMKERIGSANKNGFTFETT